MRHLTPPPVPMRARSPVEALEAWLIDRKLVDVPFRASPHDVAELRRLRTAVLAVVEAELGGLQVSKSSVATINRAAAVAGPAPRLIVRPDGLERQRTAPQFAQILGSLARDAIDLLTGSQRMLLRECAANDCRGIYVDSSPARTRRWCSTARCGNRARHTDGAADQAPG